MLKRSVCAALVGMPGGGQPSGRHSRSDGTMLAARQLTASDEK